MSQSGPPDLTGVRLVTLANDDNQELQSAIAVAGVELTNWELDTRVVQDPRLADFANEVLTGGIDWLLLVTGPGTEEILQAATRSVPRQRFLESLPHMPIGCQISCDQSKSQHHDDDDGEDNS